MSDLPTLPAVGSTDWYDHYEGLDLAARDLDTRVSALEDAPAPPGDAYLGGVVLESFAGATDTDKFAAARAYAAAQTRKPPILFVENRDYTLTTAFDAYQGFQWVGPPGSSGQQRGANSPSNRVRVSTNGPLIRLPRGTDTFDIDIRNLSFEATTSTTDFFANATGSGSKGVLWTSKFGDCAWSLFRYVIGTPTESIGMTLCTTFGRCNINNARGISIHWGGSDNSIQWEVMALDSPPNIAGTAVPYHIWYDFMEKTDVYGQFITGEQVPAAMRVSGSLSRGPLTFYGLRVEGRNAGQPSYGSIMLIDGQDVQFYSPWIAYAMANPAAATGHTGNHGLVEVSNGARVTMYSPRFNYATGVSNTTVPAIYATGAGTKVTVFDAAGWGGFTPRYQLASSATISLPDSSMVSV